MADVVNAVVEPIPVTGTTADIAVTVDPFTAVQIYEFADAKADFSVGTNFNLVAFSPLNQGLISTDQTTLVLDMNLFVGTLDPNDVTIQLNGTTIYLLGVFFGIFLAGSSVVAQGGGVFRFNLVRSTAWPLATTQELRVFPPGESP
jgi:hypothetical protein